MKYIFLATFIMSSISCASLNRKDQSLISLNEIKNLPYGMFTRKSLESKFGKASNEYSFNSDFSALNYERTSNGADLQRASFNIDNKTDQVISGLWFPNESDQLISIADFKKNFCTSCLKKQKLKNSSDHEFNNDYELINENAGVSAEINSKNNTVSSVFFFIPKEKRTPANKKSI